MARTSSRLATLAHAMSRHESHGAEQHDETESYVFHEHVVGGGNGDVGIAGAIGGGDALARLRAIGRRGVDRDIVASAVRSRSANAR